MPSVRFEPTRYPVNFTSGDTLNPLSLCLNELRHPPWLGQKFVWLFVLMIVGTVVLFSQVKIFVNVKSDYMHSISSRRKVVNHN